MPEPSQSITVWYEAAMCHAPIREIKLTSNGFKSFIFTDSAHAKRVCATEEAGYFYSRVSNVGYTPWQLLHSSRVNKADKTSTSQRLQCLRSEPPP